MRGTEPRPGFQQGPINIVQLIVVDSFPVDGPKLSFELLGDRERCSGRRRGARAFDLGSERFRGQDEAAADDRGSAGGIRHASTYNRAMSPSPQWADVLVDPTRPRPREKAICDAIRNDIGENLESVQYLVARSGHAAIHVVVETYTATENFFPIAAQ
jgi:hypothetical protein